jgi:hypothetical protein
VPNWGGALSALSHILLVVAGGDLDKPEPAARVTWAGAGGNFKTGTPSAAKVAAGSIGRWPIRRSRMLQPTSVGSFGRSATPRGRQSSSNSSCSAAAPTAPAEAGAQLLQSGEEEAKKPRFPGVSQSAL